MIGRAALLALALASPRVAVADEAPEPVVTEAGEANLERTWPRRGTSFTLAAGGGLAIGLGIEDAVGRGGSVSLRLAHAATRRTSITAELAVISLIHKVDTTSNVADQNRNDDVNVLAGALVYLKRALWLRGAAGAGIYRGRNVDVAGGNVGNVTLAGPAVAAGAGIEFLRTKHFTFGAEAMVIAMANRDGILSTGGLMLGFHFE